FHAEYTHLSDGRASWLRGGGPRAGVAWAIGDRLAMWPRAGITFEWGSIDAVAGGALHERAIALYLTAPLLFAPMKQLMFGVGPLVVAQISNDVDGAPYAKKTTVAIAPEVIGWF